MKKLREKMHKQSGFTLIEMLIVVAIIAILIAISIPLVSAALEQARIATDAANERSAKAEALIMFMTGGDEFTTGKIYAYDAENGKLEDTTTTVNPYGKATDGDKAGNHEDMILYVAVDSAGDVYMNWATSANVPNAGSGAYENSGPATIYVNTGTGNPTANGTFPGTAP